jgi:Fe-S-cluster-containing hydrogenase component 2
MYARDYGAVEIARAEYAALGAPASACHGCSGQPCAGTCPHGLAPNLLARATHALLT